MLTPKKPDQNVTFRDLLRLVIKHRADQLQLRVGLPPKFRVWGELVEFNSELVSSVKTMILEFLAQDQFHLFESGHQTSFPFEFEDNRFVLQLINMNGELAAGIRILPTNILTIDQIKLPDIFRKIGIEADLTSGLVLINGRVGSGILSSVAALRHELLKDDEHMHALSLSSDGAFLKEKSCKGLHSAMLVGSGLDIVSYDEALECAKNIDPCVIFVMEHLENLPTSAVRRIITLVKSGLLVIAGTRAGSSVDALHQMLALLDYSDRGIALQQLASVLKVSICQRLLKTPEGGRVACNEVLRVSPDIQLAIMNFNIDHINRTLSSHAESTSMKRVAKALLDKGVINAEEFEKV